MSYSFSVRASTKAELISKADAQFEQMVQAHPEHAKDESQARAALASFLEVLTEDPAKDIVASCHGYLSWITLPQGTDTLSCSFGCSVNLIDRNPA